MFRYKLTCGCRSNICSEVEVMVGDVWSEDTLVRRRGAGIDTLWAESGTRRIHVHLH